MAANEGWPTGSCERIYFPAPPNLSPIFVGKAVNNLLTQGLTY
jgi:hypothetical protein